MSVVIVARDITAHAPIMQLVEFMRGNDCKKHYPLELFAWCNDDEDGEEVLKYQKGFDHNHNKDEKPSGEADM